MNTNLPSKKDIFKLTGIPILVASLCCLSPLVLFFLGLSSAAVASSLTDTLYGSYKWLFRFIGLILFIITMILYMRSKGICTLDQAKRRRQYILNTVLLSLIVGIMLYIIWLYGIVHIVGAAAGLWSY